MSRSNKNQIYQDSPLLLSFQLCLFNIMSLWFACGEIRLYELIDKLMIGDMTIYDVVFLIL
jgi:hypothetical protein